MQEPTRPNDRPALEPGFFYSLFNLAFGPPVAAHGIPLAVLAPPFELGAAIGSQGGADDEGTDGAALPSGGDDVLRISQVESKVVGEDGREEDRGGEEGGECGRESGGGGVVGYKEGNWRNSSAG